GVLFVFNLVAEVCLGPVPALSEVLDFSVEPLSLREAGKEQCACPLQFRLTLLRYADENDVPSEDVDRTVCPLVLETLVFPSFERVNQTPVTTTAWLLSGTDLVLSKATKDCDSTGTCLQVLFAEYLRSVNSGVDSTDDSRSFVRIRSLQAVDAIRGVHRLLKEFRFTEARRLMNEHKLSSDCLWSRIDLIERLLDVCMPTSSMQMKLLLLLKDKVLRYRVSDHNYLRHVYAEHPWCRCLLSTDLFNFEATEIVPTVDWTQWLQV
ncbi:unnamed protein product, partial [Echinostoma caproni]|uniref:Vps8 domain-containing protein n=1 Tax=Echinostoma caproni TaxID=27848 RepID=A0A183AXW0_9TREM